jgi:argininosuccinate lyase
MPKRKRIYAETVKDTSGGNYAAELPMDEAEFRATLDPIAIIKNRASAGGPQPAEMDRMLKASNQRVAQQDAWIKGRRTQIASSLARLDADFEKLQGAR